MASRLSPEAVRRVLHHGQKSLPALLPEDAESLVVVDFDKILASPNAKKLVQALPAQQIYFALRAGEMELAEDILPLLATEQLVRILDYDAWPGEELVRHEAFKWLAHYKVDGPSGIYERYRSLDEEYQVALLQGCVRIYDEEEYEMLSDEHRGHLQAMPCHKLHYQLLFEREDEAQFFEDLLNSCFAGDMAYAYSLVTHAAYSVPNEEQHQLTQFRKARLEEDGFVTLEEAEQAFMPLNLVALKNKWSGEASDALENKPQVWQEDGFHFLDQVRIAAAEAGQLDLTTALHLQQGFVFLANNLCTAAGVEPNDPKGLSRVLEQAKAIVSLGLEFLADQDIERGKAILFGEHPKLMFRAGITLIDLVRDKAILRLQDLEFPQVEKMQRLLRLRRWGELLWMLDREMVSVLGLQLTEVLKGLFNRFPMHPISGLEPGEKTFQFAPIQSLAALNKATLSLESLLETHRH